MAEPDTQLALHEGLGLATPEIELTAEVRERLQRYGQAAFSENTRRAYQVALRRYATWCLGQQVDMLPSSPQTFAVYLTELADAGLSWSMVQTTVAAVKRTHGLAKLPSPTQDEDFRMVLRGIRRAITARQHQARPISSKQIKEVTEKLGDGLRDTRTRAILCAGFAGAFRRSELVSLNREDLKFDDERGLIIYLRRSKTDQEGVGRVIAIAYGARQATCPVRALKAWLKVVDAQMQLGPRDPVWLSLYGSGSLIRLTPERMSDQAINRVVKGAIESIGGDAEGYSAHSLRAGFVTEAYRRGRLLPSIMKQTGHKSADMMRRYLREEDAFRDNASEDIGL